MHYILGWFNFLIVARDPGENALCDCSCVCVCRFHFSGVQILGKRFNNTNIKKIEICGIQNFQGTTHWVIHFKKMLGNALLFVDLGTHTSKKQPLRNSPKMIFFYMLGWHRLIKWLLFYRVFVLYWRKIEQAFKQSLSRAMNLADSCRAHRSIKQVLRHHRGYVG